jgi:hypothetical protein
LNNSNNGKEIMSCGNIWHYSLKSYRIFNEKLF